MFWCGWQVNTIANQCWFIYIMIIGQSAMGYCAGRPMEKSYVFWIIIWKQKTTSFYGL